MRTKNVGMLDLRRQSREEITFYWSLLLPCCLYYYSPVLLVLLHVLLLPLLLLVVRATSATDLGEGTISATAIVSHPSPPPPPPHQPCSSPPSPPHMRNISNIPVLLLLVSNPTPHIFKASENSLFPPLPPFLTLAFPHLSI